MPSPLFRQANNVIKHLSVQESVFLPVSLRDELMLSILFEMSSQILVAELASLSQRYLDFMSGTSKPYFSMVKLCHKSIGKVRVTV